jgi:hypothetical protein
VGGRAAAVGQSQHNGHHHQENKVLVWENCSLAFNTARIAMISFEVLQSKRGNEDEKMRPLVHARQVRHFASAAVVSVCGSSRFPFHISSKSLQSITTRLIATMSRLISIRKNLLWEIESTL